jgi:DNA-directed RNA polymerase subunit RPC12/RpoP
MCARCHRTTSHPVLVHEVHAATGPGFNVYACSECADHYPPMTDALELPEPVRRRSRLTLRVYKVDAQGAVTEDQGRVEILTGGRADPLPHTSAYPPCRCPRCRTREHSTTQET